MSWDGSSVIPILIPSSSLNEPQQLSPPHTPPHPVPLNAGWGLVDQGTNRPGTCLHHLLSQTFENPREGGRGMTDEPKISHVLPAEVDESPSS